MDDTPLPSRNDPTPEARVGDSSFLPVVIAAIVVILVLFVVFLVFIKAKKEKVIPTHSGPQPTSQVIRQEPASRVG